MKIDKVCIIGIFFSLFLLTGCGSDESEPSTPPGPQPSEVEYPEVSEDQRFPSPLHCRQGHVQIAPTGVLERCTGELRQSRHIGYRKPYRHDRAGRQNIERRRMVLMHDATIERTTNGTGKVSELNYKELLSYNPLP